MAHLIHIEDEIKFNKDLITIRQPFVLHDATRKQSDDDYFSTTIGEL